MNRGIYATATGMAASQKILDMVSNNLANLSTNGFKREELTFGESFLREMRSDGGRGRFLGSLGAGSSLKGCHTVFEKGPINSTGNPLDLAIDSDKGLFAVQTDTGVRYTRDGSFSINSEGQLTTKAGHLVLDDRGRPIPLAQGQVAIDSEGTVLVDDAVAGKIGVFDGRFTKAGSNLFVGENVRPLDNPNLKAGALEGSNVNAMDAMATMIAVNRSFEMAQRSITQQDELTQRLIQSLQDR